MSEKPDPISHTIQNLSEIVVDKQKINEAARKGVGIYISKKLLRQLMETHLRSDIEQPITVTNDSNEVEEVASVKFGVKKISIYFAVKLDNYELDLKGRQDAIVIRIKD